LMSLGWWLYDAAILFTCSGRAIKSWRKLLSRHGGLGAQLFYLHSFVLDHSNRDVPFTSELFDESGFVPEKLKLTTIPTTDQRGFRPSLFVPGHSAAGTLQPLADIVELCPEPDTVNEDRKNAPTTSPPLPDSGCDAQVVRNPCGREHRQEFAIEDVTPNTWASVRCCLHIQRQDLCMPSWIWRNLSWTTEMNYGSCLPQSATYYDAHRICESLGGHLCNAETVLGCCGMGCEINALQWLRSPAAEACLFQTSNSPHGSEQVEPERRTLTPITHNAIRKRQQRFFQYSEEARGTNIVWITDRLAGHGVA